MRNPEIGTFNSRPELGEELHASTFTYEELSELMREFVGEARGRARSSKLAQLESFLEKQGADHETFVRLYEVSGCVKPEEYRYGN